MKVLFSILLMMVTLTGCRTFRQAETRTVVSDSIRIQSEETCRTDSVPGATVYMHLPPDTLALLVRLPEGIGLMRKQDDLGVNVVSDGRGGLTVRADIPAKSRTVYYKKQVTAGGKSAVAESKKELAKEPVKPEWLIPAVLLFMALSAGYVYIKLKPIKK